MMRFRFHIPPGSTEMKCPAHLGSARHATPAFTLIEVTLSMALASIVLLGITSAVMLASRALPDAGEQADYNRALDAGAALARIGSEVRFALHFSELTAHAITFSIPDRDGDGYPERVRYHWSGTPGEPLYRSYNGGSSAVILNAIQSLAFAAETETETLSYPGPDVKSSETNLTDFYRSSDQGGEKVKYDAWPAQVVQPTLPSDALYWQPQRTFWAFRYRGDTDGILNAAIHAVDDSDLPTGPALANATLNESAMSNNYAWNEVTFSSPPTLLPGDRIVFVFSQLSGKNETAEMLNAKHLGGNVGYLLSKDGGSSWESKSDRTMLHYIFGYYWTPGPTRTLIRSRYNRLAVAIEFVNDNPAPLRTAYNLDNRPYVAARYWRLTFDEPDPTQADVNADGAGDWTLADNSSFDASDIQDGVWFCEQTIRTQPDDTFTMPTTIELRMQATEDGKVGPQCWINADWGAGSANAGVYCRLIGGNGSQTLELYLEKPGAHRLLAQVTDLPQTMVDVLLVIDPTHDEAALFVQGVHEGSYPLFFESDATDPPNILLTQVEDGAAFDQVTVVVGGSY